jgi:hypothetical protein
MEVRGALLVPAKNIVELVASSTDLTDSETIYIEVLGVNRAPALNDIGSQSVLENSVLEIILSATDEDLEDSLTYSTNASFGNLSENIFTWTPGSNDSGTYNVKFNVTDGSLVDSEIVTITVSNVNHAPVLEEIGEQYVNEAEPLQISLSANDTIQVTSLVIIPMLHLVISLTMFSPGLQIMMQPVFML